MHKQKEQPVIVDNRYLLASLHYQGTHSNLYDAIDIQQEHKSLLVQIITDNHCICKLLKRLQAAAETKDKSPSKQDKHSKHIPIPHIHLIGNLKVQEINYHFVVWQKTGPSLKLFFKLLKSKFSIHTIVLLAYKLITALQQLHNHNVLHRNLKLSCIMTASQSTLLLTNLDYYTEFLTKEGRLLTRIKSNQIKLNKFSSLGQHMQQIPCPRDDLESLAYILLYLLTQGKYPPKSDSSDRSNKEKHYLEFKRQFLPEKELKTFPELFFIYFQNVFRLGIKDVPNYEILKQPFSSYLQRQEGENKFDWHDLVKIQKEFSTSSDQTTKEFALTLQSPDNDKDNKSAPISPRQTQIRAYKQLRLTLQPILEKNESTNTNPHYSPKKLVNLMEEFTPVDSSDGEISPTKCDEPIIDNLPTFEQHSHFSLL